MSTKGALHFEIEAHLM